MDKNQLKKIIAEIIQQEMSIVGYKTIGDFSKAHSFRSKVDRNLVTHPKAIEKIKNQWQKTPYPFDIFLVNTQKAKKFVEIGEVDREFIYDSLGLTQEDIQINSDHITIIFTNNSGAERVPLTGWVMAHRFGHAISASRQSSLGDDWRAFTKHLEEIMSSILSNVYDINPYILGKNFFSIAKFFAQDIGTMKSARDKKIRNFFEFGYELFAQYLITGKVTLNPLPQSIVTKILPFGRNEKARAIPGRIEQIGVDELEEYSLEIQNYFDEILDGAIGRVFVM